MDGAVITRKGARAPLSFREPRVKRQHLGADAGCDRWTAGQERRESRCPSKATKDGEWGRGEVGAVKPVTKLHTRLQGERHAAAVSYAWWRSLAYGDTWFVLELPG